MADKGFDIEHLLVQQGVLLNILHSELATISLVQQKP